MTTYLVLAIITAAFAVVWGGSVGDDDFPQVAAVALAMDIFWPLTWIFVAFCSLWELGYWLGKKTK